MATQRRPDAALLRLACSYGRHGTCLPPCMLATSPSSPHAACSPACKHMHSFGRPRRRVQSQSRPTENTRSYKHELPGITSCHDCICWYLGHVAQTRRTDAGCGAGCLPPGVPRPFHPAYPLDIYVLSLAGTITAWICAAVFLLPDMILSQPQRIKPTSSQHNNAQAAHA